MEKEIRDIIGQHVGGTYEAKQKAVDEILLLFSVIKNGVAVGCHSCKHNPHAPYIPEICEKCDPRYLSKWQPN